MWNFAEGKLSEVHSMDTVLVVEDNAVLRETLASYLRSKLKTHQVLTAEDGAQAIEVLATNPISTVLTDLAMPNIDGYKVMAYMRKMHPSIPVIIMTAAWSLDLEMLIRKMGIIRYLEKPFRLEDVDRLVVEPLQKKEQAAAAHIAA